MADWIISNFSLEDLRLEIIEFCIQTYVFIFGFCQFVLQFFKGSGLSSVFQRSRLRALCGGTASFKSLGFLILFRMYAIFHDSLLMLANDKNFANS